jgi:uracil-DNA glycosylase family 4
VSVTVTPEHPFLVNGEWKAANEIRPGDRMRMLADQCEVCGRAFFVRYDRFAQRTYRTCSYKCHNRRIFHSEGARAKVRQTIAEQYATGARDRWAITARANDRTRELVAAGEARLQHITASERRRGRLALAERINEGTAEHRIGYGEYELAAILDHIGVAYKHHFALPDSTFSYDFCLPETRILVEVRGPGFQQNGAVQERAAVRDRLAEEHGYLVVNLWWDQIVRQPDMVEQMLRRLLSNHAGDYGFVDLTVVRAETRPTRRDFPLYNVGVDEDESYVVAGMVSHNCRPPSNRDPQPDEIEACSDYLSRQIAALKPRVVVTLGRYSLGRFLPGQPISRIHGVPRRVGSVTVFPMYHPAAALHQPTLRNTLLEDMARLPGILEQLEREEPTRGPEPPEPPPEPPKQLSLF